LLVAKSAAASCKEQAIHDAFSINELEQKRVSGFRDFPQDGKKR